MAMLSDPGVHTLTAPAASLAIAATAVAALSLLALHVLSPELQPSWRMVSEYANGRHPWLLSLMFATWGLGYWALAVAAWPFAGGWTGRIGVLLLVVAGMGAASAAVFDINHRLHGLSFLLGVPTVPVAAILLTLALRGQGIMTPWWAAHLTWISMLLMGAAMAMFFSSLSKHGLAAGPETMALAALPEGVSAFNGWANRLLFACYCLWTVLAARALLAAPGPG